jgi:hypothetical protein
MENSRRMTWAWIAAPMASVLMVWVAVCALGFARYRPPTLLAGLQAAGAILIVSLLFGAPVAYAAEAIVGIPVVRLLDARHWLRWGPLVAIATVTGALTLTAAAALFVGEWDWVFGILMGGLAGATAGGCLWLVGLRARSKEPPAGQS